MSMGERLREARNKIGYSQEEVARLVEIYCTDANYILYGKEMKVMNISRVPKNCMRDIYMLLSEYLIEDYAHNENIHE